MVNCLNTIILAGDNISYLRVYPWALRLYHPSAPLYSLRLRLRLYRSASGWYNLNAHLQHHCTAFGFAPGYTEVLQGGTISMPTGRHVDNLYYPRLDKNVAF